MVPKPNQDIFQRLMAILPNLGEPPSDELLADPQATSLGAVMPIWHEVPYVVIVVARVCGLGHAKSVLYAIQTQQLTKPWWSELEAVCRYAQSLQILALLRSLSAEDRERIMAHAEASTHQYGFRQGLNEMSSEWAILCDLHQAIALGGVDRALQDMQVRIGKQGEYFPGIVQHLVDVVGVPVVA